MQRTPKDAEYYRAHLLRGDRAALSRAISAIENDHADTRGIFKVIDGHVGRAHVIGVTGAPGSGKSSLVNSLIQQFRKRGRSIGVIAVDPSSPFSGGAILGDRIRMSDHGADPEVFIRSLATQGHLGGLSRATARVIDVMDAAGKDIIIVETVGTGQSEVEVMEVAQSVLVVCTPGLGDEIQAVKAGILEIADVLVVNKADLPGAQRTARQLRDALSLAAVHEKMVPILMTTATEGSGVRELADHLEAKFEVLDEHARSHAALLRMRKLLVATAGHRLPIWLEGLEDAQIDKLCQAVLRGEIDLDDASHAAVKWALASQNKTPRE